MKVLALDYGSARTGLAISDPSGALARPLTFVERIGTPAGLEQLLAVIAEEQPELLLVGLPVQADGTRGEQANATLAFVGRLRAVCAVPVEFEDERFTSRIAETKGGASSLDDRAAAVLLQGWLDTHQNQ
ncbi:MAG: Holliday junction resolvase RuvX [Thermoleophilia bacterium]|jgi:putative holliday junction resolvase